MIHEVWSTMFNQCYQKRWGSCAPGVIKQCISAHIKGWGSGIVPPFGGNTDLLYKRLIINRHMYVHWQLL